MATPASREIAQTFYLSPSNLDLVKAAGFRMDKIDDRICPQKDDHVLDKALNILTGRSIFAQKASTNMVVTLIDPSIFTDTNIKAILYHEQPTLMAQAIVTLHVGGILNEDNVTTISLYEQPIYKAKQLAITHACLRALKT